MFPHCEELDWLRKKRFLCKDISEEGGLDWMDIKGVLTQLSTFVPAEVRIRFSASSSMLLGPHLSRGLKLFFCQANMPSY